MIVIAMEASVALETNFSAFVQYGLKYCSGIGPAASEPSLASGQYRTELAAKLIQAT